MAKGFYFKSTKELLIKAESKLEEKLLKKFNKKSLVISLAKKNKKPKK